MIKFFRKIRQQLLTENKFTKYLIYAIGEIVLVVIGILIALQINNRNNDKILSIKESKYLTNIENDLKKQLVSIEEQLSFEKEFIDAAEPILLEYSTSLKPVVDYPLMKNLTTLTFRATFVRIDPTFTDLVSSGNLGLIKNNALRNELIEYYQILERTENVIYNNNSFFTDLEFLPIIMTNALIVFELNQANRDFYETAVMKNILSIKNERMLDISKKILEEQNKELLIYNSVVIRIDRAVRHYQWLIKLRERTHKLVKDIKTENKLRPI